MTITLLEKLFLGWGCRWWNSKSWSWQGKLLFCFDF
jgi:hypothetical protein